MQVVYSKTHNQAPHSWGSCSVSYNMLLYFDLDPFFRGQELVSRKSR